MLSNEPFLNVRSNAKCVSRTEQDADIAAIHAVEKCLLVLLADFLHNGDFLKRDSCCYEFLSNVIIDVESVFVNACRCRSIAVEVSQKMTCVLRSSAVSL